MVPAQLVKQLREATGAGVMACKHALEEADGDVERATEILRQRGLASAEMRAGRQASQGLVEAYIHPGGRIGSMVEVNCETDFVARTDLFKQLVHDIALQVAATGPLAISEEELPPGAEGPPEELVLLRQPFIKDPGRTVQDVVTAAIAATGENIRVRRIARFEVGR